MEGYKNEELTVVLPSGEETWKISLLDPPMEVGLDQQDWGDDCVFLSPHRFPTVPSFMMGRKEIKLDNKKDQIRIVHMRAIAVGDYIIRDTCEKHGASGSTGPCINAVWPMSILVDEPKHRLGYTNEEEHKTLIFTPDSAYWISHPMMAKKISFRPGIFAIATPN